MCYTIFMKISEKILIGLMVVALAMGTPFLASAQVPFGGPILMIIPPSPLWPPFCPFPSFVIGPPFPGWYAFDGFGLLAFFNPDIGSEVLGMAALAPCGVVPGTLIYMGTSL